MVALPSFVTRSSTISQGIPKKTTAPKSGAVAVAMKLEKMVRERIANGSRTGVGSDQSYETGLSAGSLANGMKTIVPRSVMPRLAAVPSVLPLE